MTRKREIEVKLRVPDLRTLLVRLRQIGAQKLTRVHEMNTLFDTEDRHFQRHHAILRIRCEGKAPRRSRSRPASGDRSGRARASGSDGLLTFKGVLAGQSTARSSQRYKIREEIEYRIANSARFVRLLRRIGLAPWFKYEKYRTMYRTNDSNLEIDLDETPIGGFLELEGSKRSIDRVAKALGYSRADYIAVSYLELYRSECLRKGHTPRNMLFKTKKNR